MTRTIQIGGADDSQRFPESLELPVLEHPDALEVVQDALDQAVAERKGVAVVGGKGHGKTMALELAVKDFAAAETEEQKKNASYERLRAFEVYSPESKDRREILGAIWRAVLGEKLQTVVRGRALRPEDIEEDLVEHLVQQRVALLAFDEAENLSDEGIQVIRRLISRAEKVAGPRRHANEKFRAVGVGVLMVGTTAFGRRLKATQEAGRRWVRIEELNTLTIQQVADVYVSFLPALAAHVEEVGEHEWIQYVRREVARGRPVPIGRVENHVRNYARRFKHENPATESVGDVIFDDGLFLYTLKELPEPEDDG